MKKPVTIGRLAGFAVVALLLSLVAQQVADAASASWPARVVEGSVASGSALTTSQHPVVGGGRADTTAPAAVDDGDAVALFTTTGGALVVAGHDGTNPQLLKVTATGALEVGLTESSATTEQAPITEVDCGTTATQAFTADATVCQVCVQVAGTNWVAFGQTSEVTTANGFILKGAATEDSDPGGSYCFGEGSPRGYGGDVYCDADTGTTDVRVWTIPCD